MADDDDVQNDDDGTDLVPRHQIRELERAAKEGREAKARLVEVERENAFAKALGSQMTEPWANYFVKGYEGELTTEAIREAAASAGFGNRPLETPPPTDTVPGSPAADDLAAHQRMAAAAAGAAPPPPFDPYSEIAQAKTQEEVIAIINRADPEKYGVVGPQIQ